MKHLVECGGIRPIFIQPFFISAPSRRGNGIISSVLVCYAEGSALIPSASKLVFSLSSRIWQLIIRGLEAALTRSWYHSYNRVAKLKATVITTYQYHFLVKMEVRERSLTPCRL